MSDHTPGPWICDIRVGCCAVYAGEERNCLSYDRESFLHYSPGQWDETKCQWGVTAEAEANARLIAAAPDLLAALKWMLACALNQDEYRIPLSVIEDADKAIAKAEGR